MTFTEFSIFVECLRRIHEASITGGARTVKRNKAVGGKPGSKHIWKAKSRTQMGMAADIIPDAGTKHAAEELAGHARKLGMSALVYETGRVHLQYPPPGQTG